MCVHILFSFVFADLLSSNLCSLRGNVDRFAFSVLWEVSPKAEILSSRYVMVVVIV